MRRDPMLETAARALLRFDPLAALKLVALRSDPHALVLRGIALAQLGDFAPAKKHLARAATKLGDDDPRARARCLAALGEVTLALRDLDAAKRILHEAADLLDRHGDATNAFFSRIQCTRCLLLSGDVAAARTLLDSLNRRVAPPRLRAIAAIAEADVAMRSLDPARARAAIAAGKRAAGEVRLEALDDELARVAAALDAPVARLVRDGDARALDLDRVASVLASGDLVVDACRRRISNAQAQVSFLKRPVLLALAVALARRAPGDTAREDLIREAFGLKPSDATRVRLRVELGRLRRELDGIADVSATVRGYVLVPAKRRAVSLLLPPHEGDASAVIALLAGGESWTTSGLAVAMGKTQRSVQRALAALLDERRVEAVGDGRSRRWVARPRDDDHAFATSLLLVEKRPR